MGSGCKRSLSERWSMTSRLGLAALLLAVVVSKVGAAATPGAFTVTVVQSATGNLSDIWNEAVNGYRFWQSLIPSSGFTIQDGASPPNSFPFTFTLNVLDDQSSQSTHTALITDQINNKGSDFVLNAQPAFALAEAQLVNQLQRINIHSVTSNHAVLARNLPSVFSVAPSASQYTSQLFPQYRASNIFKIAIVYRSDIDELSAACTAAAANAAAQLLSIQATITYTASDSDTITGVAKQIAAVSPLDAVFACSLSSESKLLSAQLDSLKKPLKSIFFTNGPASANWSSSLGSISQYVTTAASWSTDLQTQDSYFGSAKDFASKYAVKFGSDPTYVAAASAAAGYTLQQALSSAFSKCNIKATGGDPKLLLYSTNVLNCSDNQNNGRQRVIDALSQISLTTFYGGITFNKLRQNYAAQVYILQVLASLIDNRPVNVPATVLPLTNAAKSIVMPQPNRYAPVCPPGSYQNPDQFLPCIPCPAGQFQPLPGQSHCDPCGKGSYSNTTGSSTCYDCPSNTQTYDRGSTSIGDCVCLVLYYSPTSTNGTACDSCPDNAQCAGGVDPPRADAGWYLEPQRPSLAFNCNPNYLCAGNYTCGQGYRGRMCAYCDEGHYWAFGRCMPCTSPGANMVAIALMYVLFIVINTTITRSLDMFHVVMNFCQYLSVINNFNVNWPNFLNYIMNYAGILSFEMDIIQPQCLDQQWSYEQNLYIQLAVPVFILLLVALWTALTYVMFRVKLKISGKTLDSFGPSGSMSLGGAGLSSFGTGGATSNAPPSLLKGPPLIGGGGGGSRSGGLSGSFSALETNSFWLFLQGLFHIPSDPAEMYELALDRASIPLCFLNLSYLIILKYCLSAFYCYDFIGIKYIYFSPNDLCYTPKHYRMMMAAAAGLVVYVGGIWFMFYHVISHLRKTKGFGDKRPLLLFGWMYERYEAQYHWYELTQLVQKTIFVLVMIFLLTDPVLQTLIALVVSIGAAMLDIKTNAIVDPHAHMLTSASDAVLGAILVLGLVFYNNAVIDRTMSLSNVVALILLLGLLAILGVYMFLELISVGILSVLMSRHKGVAKRWGHNVRHHRHMYEVFNFNFLMRWLVKAKFEDWQQWHRLCLMLHDYVHPTSETSYLSTKKVGRFWRFLLQNFPETLDYLVAVDDESRDNFAAFAEVLYEQFFDTEEELPIQLNHIVNARYKACLAQYLSSAETKDLEFIKQIMLNAFGKAKGEEAERELSRAFSRSGRSFSGALSMTMSNGGNRSSRAGDELLPAPPSTRTTLNGVEGLSPAFSINQDTGSVRGGSDDGSVAGNIYVTPFAIANRGGKNFAMEIRKSRGQVTDSGLPPTPSLMGPRSISGAVPIIGVDSPPVSGQQAPLVREGSRLQHAAGGSGALRSVLSNAGNLPSPLKNAYPGSGHRMTWADLPKEVSQVLGDEILELPVVPDSPQAGLVPRPPPSSAPATSALPAVRGSGGGYSESSNAVPAPTTPTVLDEHPGGTGTGEEVASTSPWAVPQPPPEVQAAQRRESSRAGTPLAVVVPAPTGASLVDAPPPPPDTLVPATDTEDELASKHGHQQGQLELELTSRSGGDQQQPSPPALTRTLPSSSSPRLPAPPDVPRVDASPRPVPGHSLSGTSGPQLDLPAIEEVDEAGLNRRSEMAVQDV